LDFQITGEVRMTRYNWFLVVLIGLQGAFIATAAADPLDGAYLDPSYPNLRHPRKTDGLTDGGRGILPRRSNIVRMLDVQSSIKSQGARGTCSIFSAIGALESLLISQKKLGHQLDLSEEWLEYLIMRQKTSEGSGSVRNFEALRRYGSATEELLPYIGESWESLESSPLAGSRCGALKGNVLKSCLLGHRDPALLNASVEQLKKVDPEFLAARNFARDFAREYMSRARSNYWVGTTSEIKKLLNAGIPVVLDIDFFYGAWNHRKADSLGIGRDLKSWALGLVGYPEKDSVDFEKSEASPAGHSVVLIGYDDDAKLTTRTLMKDGTTASFTYTGVYYFKNSWGTDKFGVDAILGGVRAPGYGTITQKYANDYGSFYRLELE
jgi:hypothetical protein